MLAVAGGGAAAVAVSLTGDRTTAGIGIDLSKEGTTITVIALAVAGVIGTLCGAGIVEQHITGSVLGALSGSAAAMRASSVLVTLAGAVILAAMLAVLTALPNEILIFILNGRGALIALTLLGMGLIATAGPVAGGIWIRTLTIRVLASLLNWKAGVRQLPQNWWHALFVVDIRHKPELLPDNPIEQLKSEIFWKIAKDNQQDFRDKAWLGIIVFFMFLPAYVYRLAIKSTCWFYLPLIYLVRRKNNEAADDPKEMRDRVLKDPATRIQVVFALATIGFALITATFADFGKTLQAYGNQNVISWIDFIFVLNWSAVKPWQWLSIINAILMVFLIMQTWRLNIDVDYMNKPAVAEQAFSRSWLIECVRRSQMILTIFWFIIMLAHVVFKSPLAHHFPTASFNALSAFFDR
jgi:hypothetical protein